MSDLISRKALLEKAVEVPGCISTMVSSYDIATAPAVEAEPVKHGRWAWKDGKCFCSVCSEQGEPKRRYEDGTVDEYPRCPNCGAKMDEEED